jgi:hypothetical protein
MDRQGPSMLIGDRTFSTIADDCSYRGSWGFPAFAHAVSQ